MAAAERLLRLYPRAWRERYGEEFLATVGRGPLQMQQMIDIVSGAIDAWSSTEVRGVTRPAAPDDGKERRMRIGLRGVCERGTLRYTRRDALIGAAVMLLATLALSAMVMAARRNGWTTADAVLTQLAFPGSLVLSMPFWLLKGQSWRSQAVLMAGLLAVLLAIAWLASLT